MKDECKKWGGKREFSGRKKICYKKVPFNRRINADVLLILKNYAQKYGINETEALEAAILLQANSDKFKGEKNMKIVIPASEGKLCSHFGKCDYFAFFDVDLEKKEILKAEEKIPEEGISCQSASWLASKGANIVLAGGMGLRPQSILEQYGVKVVLGCPEIELQEVVQNYLNDSLILTENSCGHDEHHHCHGEHHHCHH